MKVSEIILELAKLGAKIPTNQENHPHIVIYNIERDVAKGMISVVFLKDKNVIYCDERIVLSMRHTLWSEIQIFGHGLRTNGDVEVFVYDRDLEMQLITLNLVFSDDRKFIYLNCKEDK